jgi:hypothetical protein
VGANYIVVRANGFEFERIGPEVPGMFASGMRSRVAETNHFPVTSVSPSSGSNKAIEIA